MNRKTLSLLGILALMSAASAQTVLPVAHPDFEGSTPTDGGYDQGAVGWTSITAMTGQSGAWTDNPSTSQYFLEAPSGENYCTLLDGGGASQDINSPIVPGKSYVLSFMFGNVPGFTTGQVLEVRFRINSAVVHQERRTSPTTGGNWRFHEVTYTHPLSSPPSSSITIEFQAVDTTPGTGVSFDDVQLTEVPRYSGYDGDFAPVTSFEIQAPGSFFATGTRDGEKVMAETATSLAQVFATPADGFPTQGNQFAEVTNDLTGPTTTVPSSTLSLFFYATANLRIDWKAMTREFVPSGAVYNDTVTWTLYRIVGGVETLVSTGLLAETNGSASLWSNTPPTSLMSLSSNYLRQTATSTLSFAFNGATIGRPCVLKFTVTNGGDAALPTGLRIDNLRHFDSTQRPGTGDGLLLGTGVDFDALSPFHVGGVSGGDFNDTKSAPAGSVLHIGVDSTASTYFYNPILLAGQFFTTGGTQPTPIGAYDLWVDAGATLLVNGAAPGFFGYSYALLPGGTIFSAPVPVGFGGYSMILQLIVPSAGSVNGVIGTSDAHIINFP